MVSITHTTVKKLGPVLLAFNMKLLFLGGRISAADCFYIYKINKEIGVSNLLLYIPRFPKASISIPLGGEF